MEGRGLPYIPLSTVGKLPIAKLLLLGGDLLLLAELGSRKCTKYEAHMPCLHLLLADLLQK